MAEPVNFIAQSVTADDVGKVTDNGIFRIIIPQVWGSANNIPIPPTAPPYWTPERDDVLRATVNSEAMWGAAVGIAISKIASKSWQISTNQPRKAEKFQQLFLYADTIQVGWVQFISKHIRDFLCLAGNTRVSLGGSRVGTTKSIQEIVRDNDPGPVLCVDQNGKLTERKVTDWHKNPLGDRRWWWVSLKNSGHSKKERGGIFATDNHPVFTKERGWLRADQINPGMHVATGDFVPSEQQAQLLVGAMLGDGCLSPIRSRAVFRMSQCEAQKSWLDLKMQALAGFRWTGYKKTTSTRGYSRGKETTSYAVNSLGSVALMQWRKDWYPDGKKTMPREYVEKHFSPLMLATFFMDDGTQAIHKTRAGSLTTPTAMLYTNDFSEDDVVWLAELISSKGIACHMLKWRQQNGKEYPTIYVTAEGWRQMVKMIGAYVPPSMRYKLPDDAPAYNPALWNIPGSEPFFDEVVESRQRDHTSGYRTVKTTYNISVDGTENYIAANTLVHNCTDNGGFVEIVRKTKAAGSEITGLRHLDSRRVIRTGDPKFPVLYRDRLNKMHKLRDYQIMMFSDMADPSEMYYGVGFCSASRAYQTIYKQAAIEWYLREKVAGLKPLAIYIVNGLLQQQIEGAVRAAQEQTVSKGLAAYMGAVMVGVPSDKPPEVATIPLAELPDRFNRKEEFDLSLLTYAAALGLDPQDLQPLSGSGLGSGTQSVVLHHKAAGRGMSNWLQQWTHQVNTLVLPKNVKWVWVEKDISDMSAQADYDGKRINNMKAALEAGFVMPEQGVQVLVDQDILPAEFLPKDSTAAVSLSDVDKTQPAVTPMETADASLGGLGAEGEEGQPPVDAAQQFAADQMAEIPDSGGGGEEEPAPEEDEEDEDEAAAKKKEFDPEFEAAKQQAVLMAREKFYQDQVTGKFDKLRLKNRLDKTMRKIGGLPPVGRGRNGK